MADTMRITLELELNDNPPLYQDLAKFPKGPRRVNRLLTLAHAGLMSQSAPHTMSIERAVSLRPEQDATLQAASLELFGPALGS